MLNEDLENEFKELSTDEKELTEHLLKMARAYKDSRKNFKPTQEEINMKIKDKAITSYTEKAILFNETRIELRKEANKAQQKIANATHKELKHKLSKKVRKRLGIKSIGRPEGSKTQGIKYSKKNLEDTLTRFINNYFYQEGKSPTQEEAAKALDLGYAKALQRLRKRYGDTRDWQTLVRDILERE